jgi:hypothetical protein
VVLRVKPHTDPTDITILAFEHGPGGLQVLPDGCSNWVDVHHIPGRGLHSSTFQLNLSQFPHKIHPRHPLIPPSTS